METGWSHLRLQQRTSTSSSVEVLREKAGEGAVESQERCLLMCVCVYAAGVGATCIISTVGTDGV